jgi:N-acetylglucosamine kinase-like BadF-type ATPase
MILIADSGSTKTDWCLADGSRTIEFQTAGYNPYYSSGEELAGLILPKLPEGFDLNAVEQVAFYGAGVYEEKHEQIREVIGRVFPHATIHAAMDLVGSARSLLGRQPGFAAILGTGTNSCIYDGRRITHNIDSLGFFLGDEGSGGYMGKRLLGDYIRGYMPQIVQRQFYDTYQLTGEQLIDRIYSDPMPNRYCASFARFLSGPLAGHDYLEQTVIRGSFRDFFDHIVKHYPDYRQYTFNCVGSIGWIFREPLSEVVREAGMEIGKIVGSPMAGLVCYHCEKGADN